MTSRLRGFLFLAALVITIAFVGGIANALGQGNEVNWWLLAPTFLFGGIAALLAFWPKKTPKE